MTYIKLKGGIGNQLFQVAAAFAYSKKYKTELYLDASEWHASQGRDALEYKNTIFKNFTFDSSYPRSVYSYDEEEFNYKEIFRPKCYNPCIKLSGYFQSLKYFEEYKDEFLEMLEFPDIDYNPSDNTIGVHIRRGDYITFSHIFDICDRDYFEQAISQFDDIGDINILTDSKDYSEDVFQPLLTRSGKIIKSDDELKDLVLLSKHKNLICSNSSFSWWASFIGVKKNKIIVPKIWFKNIQNHDDIYREEFTKI